jgi:hypothetical protein
MNFVIAYDIAHPRRLRRVAVAAVAGLRRDGAAARARRGPLGRADL